LLNPNLIHSANNKHLTIPAKTLINNKKAKIKIRLKDLKINIKINRLTIIINICKIIRTAMQHDKVTIPRFNKTS